MSPENPTDAVPASPDALEVEGLAKAYGSRLLFRDLSLRVRPGEQIALIGESGSGKSTLLNLLAGLDRPDAGRIQIAGHLLAAADPDASAALRRRHIGFVFQAFHLLPHLDAVQNVSLALLLQGLPVQQARQRSLDLLTQLGLAARSRAMPAQLSGGEQQRVALARALVHRPSLILADEPTGNLDAETARKALDLMLAQCAGQGSALLMVTHSDFAAERCSRVLKLGPDGLQGA